jgi:hypothetical protein
MSNAASPPAPTPPDADALVESRRAQLAELIERFTVVDGIHEMPIEDHARR